MAQLEFKCERCGKLLTVDAPAGSEVTCSHCQSAVRVPKVQPPPRPAPQVMGGVRPQPMAVAAPAPVAMAPPPLEEAEPAGEPSSALAAMSVLMPWAVSIVFHIAFLLVMMFFTFLIVEGGRPADADEDADAETLEIPTDQLGDSDNPGSPVVTKFNGIEPYGPGKDKTDFSKPAPDLLDAGGTNGKQDPFATIGIIVPGAKGTAGGSGDGPGVGANGLGNMFGSGNGGGRGSRFFGSGLPKGNIYKVIYVVDNSGSMFETFSYVKAELMRSINQLHPRQQYDVIAFADGPPTELAIEGAARLQYATPQNKRATKEWVDKLIAVSKDGKTDPRPAMERAFKVPGGPPELIYLLTDGMFPRETLQTISQLNFSKKVHVNTIAFRDRTGEELMQEIAKGNAGNYKYISPEELGSDY